MGNFIDTFTRLLRTRSSGQKKKGFEFQKGEIYIKKRMLWNHDLRHLNPKPWCPSETCDKSNTPEGDVV